MAKKQLLVSAPVEFIPDLQKKLTEAFDCKFGYQLSRDETIRLLSTHAFDGWLVSPCPTYYIDESLLKLCPSIKAIATPSTGSNHIDLDYLRDCGIEFFSLKNSAAVNEIYASSEFTFGLMLATIRRIPFSFDSVRLGNWRNSEHKWRARELCRMTLGIIGFGRIGQNLGNYSLAFGMDVVAFDPYKSIEDALVEQVDSLPELLEVSDAIAVCVDLSKETYHLIDHNVFSRMKEGVYFINTSRGDVVDEEALLEHLKNGKITAAGVDVISDEITGEIEKHKLVDYAKQNSNLLITPHIAGLTTDSERTAQLFAFTQLQDFLLG